MTNDAPARKRAPRKAASLATQPRRATSRRTTGKAEAEPLADTGAPAAAGADSIEFLGRSLRVRMPTPEQIMVWQRTAKKLQGSDAEAALDTKPRPGETQEDANRRALEYGASVFDRLTRVVTSVLVDPADRDWVEDKMLDGDLGLMPRDGQRGAADIITIAVEKLTGRSATSAAAPTTGPAPKARRRT